MKKVVHKSENRGIADYGWLKGRHSFSFAEYYDPKKIHFGKLRVLNDDIISPGKGFGTHPHENMEIISVPIYGSLEHKDSMGNGSIIKSNEIQVMSAGTGILHSEFNPSSTDDANFLQIWIFPEENDITPRYDQLEFNENELNNQFKILVTPEKNKENTVWINQKAFLHLGNFDANFKINYPINITGNGVYVFIIEGSVTIEGETLNRRDAIGISEIENLSILTTENSKILLMEIPMN
ncbi:MAG: pirin family protein [Bacteroidetes bacterium]|nr:pirin family protein [Bacteroidota bacterium]